MDTEEEEEKNAGRHSGASEFTSVVEGHPPWHSSLEDGIQTSWSSSQLCYDVHESIPIQRHRLGLRFGPTF